MLALAASKKIVQDPDFPTNANHNPWVFKFAQNDDFACDRLISVIAAKKSGAKVGFIYSDDGFGKSGSEAFSGSVQKSPIISVHFERSFPKELVNAETIVDSVPDGLDGIVIWGTAPGPNLLVKAFRTRRPSMPIYLSHGNASHEFANSVGITGEQVIVVGSRVLVPEHQLNASDERDKVIQEYQKFWSSNFPEKPISQFSGYARDAFEASIAALRKVKKADREKFRDALEAGPTPISVTGAFRFSRLDHAGLDARAFEVFQIKGGNLLLLDDSTK